MQRCRVGVYHGRPTRPAPVRAAIDRHRPGRGGIRQVAIQLLAAWITGVWPDLEQGLEHKGSAGDGRVGQPQLGAVQAVVCDQQDIEIQGAIRPVTASAASGGILELATARQQLRGRQGRAKGGDAVEKPAPRRSAGHGWGAVPARHPVEPLPGGCGQLAHRPLQGGPTGAEAAAQADGGAVAGRTHRAPSAAPDSVLAGPIPPIPPHAVWSRGIRPRSRRWTGCRRPRWRATRRIPEAPGGTPWREHSDRPSVSLTGLWHPIGVRPPARRSR